MSLGKPDSPPNLWGQLLPFQYMPKGLEAVSWSCRRWFFFLTLLGSLGWFMLTKLTWDRFKYICPGAPQGTMRGSETPQLLGNWDFYAFYSILSWAENWAGVWGFKGKKDNSEEDGKSMCLVNQCLPGHARDNGHREDLAQRFMKLSHDISSKPMLFTLSLVMVNSFRQLRG